MSTIGMRAVCAFACFASVLHAQRPGPTLKQLDHKAWTIRDGAPPNVLALAQSADGVLWIGTQSGLYRFDGVRFEESEPPAGQSLPSQFITALLAVPDGSMWIGYLSSGVSIIAADRLVNFGQNEGLPPGSITAFARDSGGAIWAATTTGLARFDGTRWRTLGAERFGRRRPVACSCSRAAPNASCGGRHPSMSTPAVAERRARRPTVPSGAHRWLSVSRASPTRPGILSGPSANRPARH